MTSREDWYSYSKIDITPDPKLFDVQLGAYRKIRDCKRLTASENKIYAKLFKYSISGEVYYILSLDLLWIDNELYEFIVQKANKIGIKASSILIVCTHTHSAPYVSNGFEFYGRSTAGYRDFFLISIERLFKQEQCRKTITSVSTEVYDASHLICNRNKVLMSKNRIEVVNTPNLNLPREKNIRCVNITNIDGEVFTLINFSCHPTFNKKNYISRDYIKIVEEVFTTGKGDSLFLQGFAGDQKFFCKKILSRQTLTGLKKLQYTPSFDEKINLFEKRLKRIRTQKNLRKNISPVINTVNSYESKKLVLSNGFQLSLIRFPLPGGLVALACNAEMTFDLAEKMLNINESIWPVGYANGMVGYIPSPILIECKSGYEYISFKNFGATSNVNTDDYERIVQETLKLISY